ncbi:hypothetical protein ACFX13_030131 [Malus domestica]
MVAAQNQQKEVYKSPRDDIEQNGFS